jgi:hypothetical protein
VDVDCHRRLHTALPLLSCTDVQALRCLARDEDICRWLLGSVDAMLEVEDGAGLARCAQVHGTADIERERDARERACKAVLCILSRSMKW